MKPRIDTFIQANLPLAPVPFVPEIKVHKAVPTSGLWRLADQDEGFGNPYWAHYWAGGLALARFILDAPDHVADKRVLDLGTGSGLVAIAAARAGAGQVVAADVDPYAIAAAELNAAANDVSLELVLGDLTREHSSLSYDLILVGDLFYDAPTAARVLRFLEDSAELGCGALIGDPWRAFLPQERLEPLATYHLSEATGEARDPGQASTVFRFRP